MNDYPSPCKNQNPNVFAILTLKKPVRTLTGTVKSNMNGRNFD